jgi:hypothetical protein
MDCPKCSSPTTVLDTREREWRRRGCKNPNCDHRFYTQEIIVAKPKGVRLRGRPTARPKAPPKQVAPVVAVVKPAERKPLPLPAFSAREALGDGKTTATPPAQNSVPAFSFALTMPPGAAIRLNR